ncbi:MAG: hypothetical protein ACKOFW_09805, partial [Planctomycetaceae bacterium]
MASRVPRTRFDSRSTLGSDRWLPSHEQRRGGSPYFSEVKTPYDLIARIHSDKISMEEAISRVEGVLVGRG